MPIAGKCKIADFALSNRVNFRIHGIRRIGVLTQYKAQSLIRHVERGWGAKVRRSILFSKVRVAEGSLIEDSLLLPHMAARRDVRLRRWSAGEFTPEG